MKPDVQDKLADAGDFHSLTRDILALCEPFGAVHSFRLVHNRGASRVACLIELESPKQQAALARSIGARVLNGAVCFDVPVGRDFAAPGKGVPLGNFAAPPSAATGAQAAP